MDIIIGILAFLLVLGTIILVHEWGHYIFAKRANILVREFAFGMGPIIFKKKKGETLYTIRAFPVGGFCAITGEEFEEDPLKNIDKVKVELKDNVITKIYINVDDESVSHLPTLYLQDYDIYDEEQTGKLYIRSIEENKIVEYQVDPQAMIKTPKEEYQIAPYNRTIGSKTKRQRGLVMIGGVMMNFLLAILVFLIAAVIKGFPDYNSSTVGKIDQDSISYQAGLRENDKIIRLESGSINVEIKNFKDISKFLGKYEDSFPSDIIKIYVEGKSEPIIVRPIIIINSIGIMNDSSSNLLKIKEVVGPAQEAGLKPGMIIAKINDEVVSSWGEIYQKLIQITDGSKIKITTSDNKDYIVTPYSKFVLDNQRGLDGSKIPVGTIGLDIVPKYKFDLGKTLVDPFQKFGSSFMMVIGTLKLLFTPKSGVGFDDLSGFVGIYSATKSIALTGFYRLLLWMGILSVNVGILNLLPIPALDGGRLIFLGYEVVTGKKPNQKVETALITATFILLLILIVFVTFNDITRLFS